MNLPDVQVVAIEVESLPTSFNPSILNPVNEASVPFVISLYNGGNMDTGERNCQVEIWAIPKANLVTSLPLVCSRTCGEGLFDPSNGENKLRDSASISLPKQEIRSVALDASVYDNNDRAYNLKNGEYYWVARGFYGNSSGYSPSVECCNDFMTVLQTFTVKDDNSAFSKSSDIER